MERRLRRNDGDIKPSTRYDYQMLMSSASYNHPDLFRKMKPEEFDFNYYHTTGLSEILLFDCPPSLLGMRMVDGKFSLLDVQRLIGGNKVVTGAEVATQKSVQMQLSEFVRLFNAPAEPGKAKTIYNIVSLDFSTSQLAEYISPPSLLHSIDWSLFWPDERRKRILGFEKNGGYKEYKQFPSFDRFLLISPENAFTDMHLDFGGTSFWLHVVWGCKIFFLIPPSEATFELYENYMRSSANGIFFGDVADRCVRVVVGAGSTLVIPSGWLHAVLTPQDTLAFSGNFLHSRAASMQLRVQKGEGRLRLNSMFRYPYLDEIILFLFAAIVEKVTNRVYIRPSSIHEEADCSEYVGERFVEDEVRKRIPVKQDYNEIGGLREIKTWEETEAYTSSMEKLRKWDDKKGRGGEEEKENVSMLGQDQKNEEKEGNPQPDDSYIDHTTFYHAKSCEMYQSGSSALHKLPLPHNEPILIIDLDALRDAVHPMEIAELEALLLHMKRKPKLSLPEGLSRPSSLLALVGRLLRARREQADEEGVTLPSTALCKENEQRGRKRTEKKAGKEHSDSTARGKRLRKEEKAKEETSEIITRSKTKSQ